MTSDTSTTASALYPRRSFFQRLASTFASITSPEPLKRVLYSMYGARLQSKIAGGPMPRHIVVVLDGNPLADMRQLGAIVAVVKDGRVLSRVLHPGALESLLRGQ